MADIRMEVYRELTGNILGWWMDHMIDPRGGFYGRMDGEGRMYEDSPKGAILNSRILWTFASAYRIATAERTRELFTDAQRFLIGVRRYFSAFRDGGEKIYHGRIRQTYGQRTAGGDRIVKYLSGQIA